MISNEWFNSWLSFLYGNQSSYPSQIDNTALASRIINEGSSSLIKNVDYFPIPQQTWKALFNLYRGGPVIKMNINGKVEIIAEEGISLNDQTEMNDLRHVKIMNKQRQLSQVMHNE